MRSMSRIKRRDTGTPSCTRQTNLFSRAQLHSLDDVRAVRPRRWVAGHAQLVLHYLRHQFRALEGLADHAGRHEQALEQRAVQVEGGTSLHARRAQSDFRGVDEGFLASDVPTRWRQRASEVLDQRPGDEVRADMTRLQLLHQLAVAVVHEYDEVSPLLLELHVEVLAHASDLLHWYRGPPLIPAGSVIGVVHVD